jgi:2-C-methyl-D-erythritol 4-phosphate cytidylyltransferase
VAVALIVAAGRGERLGMGKPKALVMLAGRSMLEWSVLALGNVPAVERIVIALPADQLSAAPAGTQAVAGGTVRSESVRAALAEAGDGDPVIVHDAARPLATEELFSRAIGELERSEADGVIAAAPVPDTLKQVGDDGKTIVRTVDRSSLWAVQTPQVFRRAALERALAREDLLAAATDDAWLVEQDGGSVRVIEAGQPNFKITAESDLRLAELLLSER